MLLTAPGVASDSCFSSNECNCTVGLIEALYIGKMMIFENSLMFRVMRGSSVRQTKAATVSAALGMLLRDQENDPSHTKRNSQPSPPPPSPPPHWLRCLMSAFLHSYAQDRAWPGAKVGPAGGQRSPGKTQFQSRYLHAWTGAAVQMASARGVDWSVAAIA